MPSGPDILLYDPYLDTLGGGERYIFGLASAWRDIGRVTVAGGAVPEPGRLRAMGFPGDLEVVGMKDWQFAVRSRRYDVTVSMVNELPGWSGAARALLVVQFPFPFWLGRHPVRRTVRRALRTQLLAQYECLVYSHFVREWLERRWSAPSTVLFPPVRLRRYVPTAKRRTILAVGRFFVGDHSKRQDTIIEVFAKVQAQLPGWRLVLAGGVAQDGQSQAYLGRLRELASGLPVEIVANADAARLDQLFAEASLFVHAAGYGRSPDEPEKAEHFGISTVEAMSAGAVPLVYADGGQLEIVERGTGVLWIDLHMLSEQLVALAGDSDRRAAMAQAGVASARRFDEARFEQEALRILGGEQRS